MKIAQIGHGFVGASLHKSFGLMGCDTVVYDKYQGIGEFEDVLDSDAIFMCLPTPHSDGDGFDISAIEESLEKLCGIKYSGLCVIKSTVLPGTSKKLSLKYNLNIAHSPEFLTERTAFEDLHNQKHIVLGRVYESDLFDRLILLYKKLYRDAYISICTSCESESMKIFLNAFYAQKVMIFNEFYLLSNAIGLDFERVKGLMLKNNWIAPHHVHVPGPDGKLAYGGHCFPKDTNALSNFMKNKGTANMVLDASIRERNKIRDE